jgi:putative Ca2+/H+ antiporter (TMEM165/GDT1 family)
MNATLFGTAFVAVLLAELVGDKLLYGAGALAARIGARTVLLGAIPAFAAKSLVAVMLGGAIARLPHAAVAASSSLAFALTALTIWREPQRVLNRARAEPSSRGTSSFRGALSAFTTIFFAEWADPGQLATAAFAARYGAPVLVWAAASSAMATKAILALAVGSVLHRYAPQRAVRWAGASLGVALALSSALQIRG